VDFRVVCATNQNLEKLVEEGKFREDLYFRVNVITVYLPPLRERREDIPLLFQHFVLVAGARYQLEPRPPRPEQLQRLMLAGWPGNVRELRNAAERYVLLGEACGYDIDQVVAGDSDRPPMTLPEQLACFERSLIEQQLKASNGSIRDTMAALGLPRKTLYDKMKKYKLDRANYK
jgi:two-component system C4-dicarboxylate transport response regulator DctD